MKAKFVFEVINFERGGDPITTMGIGKDWTPRELGILYRKMLDKLGPLKLKRQFADEALEMIPQRHLTLAGWGNLDKIFDQLDEEEFEEMKKFILRYHNLIK
jgi:hypothetical protein